MTGLSQIRETHEVPARTGKGFTIAAGELIRITDLEGSQPVDFWAFTRADHLEFLSYEHTKPSIERLFPHVGDSAYTDRRRAIVTVVDDASPGQHDSSSPPAIPRTTPSSGSRATTRAARRTCTRRSPGSASGSTSRRSPGTSSPTSSSTPTGPSPSRRRNRR